MMRSTPADFTTSEHEQKYKHVQNSSKKGSTPRVVVRGIIKASGCEV